MTTCSWAVSHGLILQAVQGARFPFKKKKRAVFKADTAGKKKRLASASNPMPATNSKNTPWPFLFFFSFIFHSPVNLVDLFMVHSSYYVFLNTVSMSPNV